MNTRNRVVDYLNQSKEPVSFNSIRHLGTDKPLVRWESVVAIVNDLEKEKIIKINIIKNGKLKAFMVVKK
jgi:hypothetical protein